MHVNNVCLFIIISLVTNPTDEEYIPIKPETVSVINNGGDDMILNEASSQDDPAEVNVDTRSYGCPSSTFVHGLSISTFTANEYSHCSTTVQQNLNNEIHSYVTINSGTA